MSRVCFKSARLALPVAVLSTAAALAQSYRAEQITATGVPIVCLTDSASSVHVSIVRSIENRACETNVPGKNILSFPSSDVSEFQKRPRLCGNPFLGGANGRNYDVNVDLGNVRGERPICGLPVDSPLWYVSEAAADANAAHVAREPREQWIAHLPARVHVVADDHKLFTAEMRPLGILNPLRLQHRTLDDGFTDPGREPEGRTHFWIEHQGKIVETLFGPTSPVATIWLPRQPEGQTREFICFEPLAIINGGEHGG